MQKSLHFKRLIPSEKFDTFLPQKLEISVVMDTAWKRIEPIFFVNYVRGLRSIHQLNLADVSRDFPSPSNWCQMLTNFVFFVTVVGDHASEAGLALGLANSRLA
jgi:hypothetical protein